MFLTGDNASMWSTGNLFAIIFFTVIVILGVVVWRIVAGGSSVSHDEDEE